MSGCSGDGGHCLPRSLRAAWGRSAWTAPVACLLAVTVIGCRRGDGVRMPLPDRARETETETETEEDAPPPPLAVDREAPLLLEEASSRAAVFAAAVPEADNRACLHCHANFETEPLAREHARALLGCVQCHGESRAHRNDENNVTPPDVMYPDFEIDPACERCHPGHDVPAAAVVSRWRELRPARVDPGRIVCTDCHGAHRLEHRTVRWDRRSGRLVGGAR